MTKQLNEAVDVGIGGPDGDGEEQIEEVVILIEMFKLFCAF